MSVRVQRTPKSLRKRGQTDRRKCRHIKAKRVQAGMTRVGNSGNELITRAERVPTKGSHFGVRIYTTRYPTGLYYGANSLVPVL